MSGKILGQYQNGNARIMIFEDGTKIRAVDGIEYIPECPESMDVKICNRCNNNCSFCYANSTIHGELGELKREFFKTLKPYTEIAIGGGNPLEHPGLVSFLGWLREMNLIPNLTVHQNHFVSCFEGLNHLLTKRLIYGLGVSVQHVTPDLLWKLGSNSNIVVHAIAGVMSIDELRKLYNKNIKLLVLGYKNKGRGTIESCGEIEQINSAIKAFGEELKNNVDKFNVVSFDNLAISQLNVKDWMSEEEWETFYLGDDGKHSMYVDLVRGEFASSSVSDKYYPLMDEVSDMLKVVRNEG